MVALLAGTAAFALFKLVLGCAVIAHVVSTLEDPND